VTERKRDHRQTSRAILSQADGTSVQNLPVHCERPADLAIEMGMKHHGEVEHEVAKPGTHSQMILGT